MREMSGRRVAGQSILTKPIYPQYFFQTKSDQTLQKQLAGLKKTLHSRHNSKHPPNHHFYQPTSQQSIHGEDEKQPRQVWTNGEVNSSDHEQDQWKMGDDSSFIQMVENYSSSESSSYPSPEKQFQNIQLPQRKIRISEYLEQMRKEALHSTTSPGSPQESIQ